MRDLDKLLQEQYYDWKETCRRVDMDSSLKKELTLDTLTSDTNILDWGKRNHYLSFTIENGEMKIHIKDRNLSDDVGCIPLDMLYDKESLKELIAFLKNAYNAYHVEGLNG